MKKYTVLVAFAAAAVLVTAGVARAVPVVSNVKMQQIAGKNLVQITYDLADEAAIVTLAIETNGVPIPDSAVTWLSGDVSKVVQTGNVKSIIWNAGADWPEHVVTDAKARVTAWSTNAPPEVMVINLDGGPLTNRYPVTYYTSVEALPGGVTNNVYKSVYLVMQKVPKGLSTMGEGKTTQPKTLADDFYVGVYQVTQGHWYNVMGGDIKANFIDAATRAIRPMESVSYHYIRENAIANTPLYPGWPYSNAVGADSFMGLLRSRTGLAGFDLPTSAQWEYACRAGTTSYYNDGLGTPSDTVSNDQMDVLGRYNYNGGAEGVATSGPERGTAIVGSYRPNTWGLYDMHGNVWEFCLDWYSEANSTRVKRGGSWNFGAGDARSAFVHYHNHGYTNNGNGFRVVRTLAQ